MALALNCMATRAGRGAAGCGKPMQNGAHWRFLRSLLSLTLLLGGCSHSPLTADATEGAADQEINTYPANYKPDILGAMHAYLNDPTGVRDTGIADPALKTVGGNVRYVVCVRFNAKKRGTAYTGVKQVAAVFIAGRFDRFVESAREQCDDATYKPFPELEKLTR